MKFVFLMVFLFLSSLLASAQIEVSLPKTSQEVLRTLINQEIYFEDEGHRRAIDVMNKFSFKLIDSNVLIIDGLFYSDWDMKELSIECGFEVLTREIILKSSDVKLLYCDLFGEQWPYQRGVNIRDDKIKKTLLQVINQYIYFEDDGYRRDTNNISDVTFNFFGKNLIEVTGKFYSEWDDRQLEINCLIRPLKKGDDFKVEDFQIESCEIYNEEWPYYNN